jgi:hypothetical protein
MTTAKLTANASVFSLAEQPSDYADLKNTLLYANNVGWISFENYLFVPGVAANVKALQSRADFDQVRAAISD